MNVRITKNASSKIARHGLNVYPLEAFGLLVGTKSDLLILTVLPVGRTMHWYDISDRFLGLDQAASVAAEILADRNLEVLGVYHTFSGSHPDFQGSDMNPLCQAPDKLRNGFVIIRPLHGGETIWGYSVYAFNQKNGWNEVDSETVEYHSIDPQLNPKRIHRDWLAAWGQIVNSNREHLEG